MFQERDLSGKTCEGNRLDDFVSGIFSLTTTKATTRMVFPGLHRQSLQRYQG